jgi:hypothetical protein
MRSIRWKKRYLTGNSKLDERNRALIALLTDLRDELGRVEHCQEMNELATRLVELAQQRLSNLSQDPEVVAESEAAIRNLLKNEFPLAALSTPACRECGLCDLMADKVGNWLSERSEM